MTPLRRGGGVAFSIINLNINLKKGDMYVTFINLVKISTDN